jgi:hypothetical protein
MSNPEQVNQALQATVSQLSQDLASMVFARNLLQIENKALEARNVFLEDECAVLERKYQDLTEAHAKASAAPPEDVGHGANV